MPGEESGGTEKNLEDELKQEAFCGINQMIEEVKINLINCLHLQTDMIF